jgi:hypothetical protein
LQVFQTLNFSDFLAVKLKRFLRPFNVLQKSAKRIEADAFKLMKKNPNAKIVGNVGFDKAK